MNWKQQRGGFLSIPWGTLGASLLGNVIPGKGVIPAGNGVIRGGNGLKKKKGCWRSPHPFSK